jgi:hypothetical protein
MSTLDKGTRSPNEQLSFGTILESQAAFETTFRVTGGYLKGGTNFLERVGILKRFSEFASDFIEASRNCI